MPMNKNNSRLDSSMQIYALIVLTSVFVKMHYKIHGCDIMKDLIKKKVLSKKWSFLEVSDLANSISSLANEIYIELSLQERFELVRDVRINENMVGRTYEDMFRAIGLIQIQADMAEVVKQMLNSATVNFGGNNNEISENGLGGESNKKRSTDEEKKDDNKK